MIDHLTHYLKINSKAMALVLSLIISPLVYSQAIESASEEEVSALLAEIEEKNRTRTIFGVNSRRKIAEVDYMAKFKVIKTIGNWRIVEFQKPTVPGWVSSDYVNVNAGKVRIEANRLNLRLQPSLDSIVLMQLERGYETSLIGRRDGFVNVLAPASFRVAINTINETVANDKESNALLNNTTSTSFRPERSETPTILNKNESVIEGNKSLNSNELSDAQSATVDQNRASSSTERLHVIAPGDALSLQVFGEKDLSIENIRVPQSGQVSFPLIGSVSVAGRTIPQIEQNVARLLGQGYVNNPRLSVTIFSYRPIFIRGAVDNTGAYPFTEGLTVGQAIALAGGSKKSAKRDGVSILRDGTVVEDGISIDSLVKVQSGDVISIEEEVGVQENDASYIYLHGEVASPGEYQFRRDLTVEKAIVLAGGFTLRGSRKKISVTRYADAEKGGEPIKLKKVKLYTPIRPGDIINVGATWF